MDSIFLLDSETRVRGAVDRRGQVLRQTRRVVDPETGNVALGLRGKRRALSRRR